MKLYERAAVVIPSILAVTMTLLLFTTNGSLDHRIDQLQNQVTTLKLENLKQQVKYEGVRNERDAIQRDLVAANERLAQAAERDRAAKVRASRSRSRSNTKTNAPVRVEQSASPFAGGLRKITMYCPTGGRTASGKIPQRGMVATISRAIPFGTHILIEGLGEYTVEDRIGHGSEFDIFTPSCAEADRFGVEHRRVTIEDVS